jgi:hypothetical protein
MLIDTGKRLEIDNIELKFYEHKNRLNQPTGRFFYDPWIISNEYRNTEFENILNYFPTDIGEARIMVLNPGQSYLSHADIDDRYHLSVQSQESYLIDLENKIMHPTIKDNIIWEMDAGKLHTASNFGRYDRLQLVVRKLLKENLLKSPSKIILSCESPPTGFRYAFDNCVSNYLNRAVKRGILNNFSTDGTNTVSFEIEEDYITELHNVVLKTEIDISVTVNGKNI